MRARKRHKIKIPAEWGLEGFFSEWPPELLDLQTSELLLRLVADINTDPKIVGTATVISDGVMLTAKHVLEEWWDATEPGAVNRSLTALQHLRGNRFFTWQGSESTVHKNADMAVFRVVPSNKNKGTHRWVYPPRIRPDAPREGDWIVAFGYTKGKLQASRNPDGSAHLEVADQPRASFGVVKKVYETYRDRVMLPCPCFEVSADLGAGMSGGPVFDKNGSLCGIVSSGFEGAASSHVVTLGPSLAEIYPVNFGVAGP